MQEIGAFEAKNRFAEVLRQVELGESFCITRHGKPVAWISAPQTPDYAKKTKGAFTALRQLRTKLNLTPDEIAKYKAEGRL